MLSPVDELLALDARLRQIAAHRQKAAHADDIPTAEALDAYPASTTRTGSGYGQG
jgi:hypothetical protein